MGRQKSPNPSEVELTVADIVTAHTQVESGGTWANLEYVQLSSDGYTSPIDSLCAAAFLYGFNGSAWDRLRVNAAKDLLVAVNAAIPAGTNNIGDVDVATLPATVIAGMATLPAGTNNIGDVDVATLPTLPAGTNAIGKVGHDITGIADGRKVVAAAGTRETLVAASTPAKTVIITAETDNTGVIVVGGSTCVAALATRQGTPLDAGDSIVLEVDDLVDVYIDATVNGDGVTFTYET